jgi:hypothetical protein
MAERFGFVPKKDLLKKQQVVDLDTLRHFKAALCKAIEDKALPDMKLMGVLDDYLGVKAVGKPNGFAFFVEGRAIMIHEDDPRWQGCFFHHLFDFVTVLEDEPITLHW